MKYLPSSEKPRFRKANATGAWDSGPPGTNQLIYPNIPIKKTIPTSAQIPEASAPLIKSKEIPESALQTHEIIKAKAKPGQLMRPGISPAAQKKWDEEQTAKSRLGTTPTGGTRKVAKPVTAAPTVKPAAGKTIKSSVPGIVVTGTDVMKTDPQPKAVPTPKAVPRQTVGPKGGIITKPKPEKKAADLVPKEPKGTPQENRIGVSKERTDANKQKAAGGGDKPVTENEKKETIKDTDGGAKAIDSPDFYPESAEQAPGDNGYGSYQNCYI